MDGGDDMMFGGDMGGYGTGQINPFDDDDDDDYNYSDNENGWHEPGDECYYDRDCMYLGDGFLCAHQKSDTESL